MFIQRTKNQVNRTGESCYLEQYWMLDRIEGDIYHLTRPGETIKASVYFKGRYGSGREHIELKVKENDTYHDKLENITCFERYVATPDWLQRFRQKHALLADSATRIQSLVRGFLVRNKCNDHDWVFMGREMYEPSMYECRKCDRQTRTPPLKRKHEEVAKISDSPAKKIKRWDLASDEDSDWDSDCCDNGLCDECWQYDNGGESDEGEPIEITFSNEGDFSMVKEGLMQT